VTGDGIVTLRDIIRIAIHIGSRSQRYDVNHDGRVTIRDLLIAVVQYGDRC
jgi:hypothetical protein